MLTLLAKILSALNSDAEPSHISLAIAFAMFMGMNPLFGLLSLIAILFVLSLRVHLATFLALYAVFSALAVAIAPLLSGIGELLLTSEGLNVFWTGLYQTYWFRVFEFNNSLVLGGAVFSILAFIPVFLLGRMMVVKYRQSFMAFVSKFKVVQSLKASKLFRVYQTVHQG